MISDPRNVSKNYHGVSSNKEFPVEWTNELGSKLLQKKRGLFLLICEFLAPKTQMQIKKFTSV